MNSVVSISCAVRIFGIFCEPEIVLTLEVAGGFLRGDIRARLSGASGTIEGFVGVVGGAAVLSTAFGGEPV